MVDTCWCTQPASELLFPIFEIDCPNFPRPLRPVQGHPLPQPASIVGIRRGRPVQFDPIEKTVAQFANRELDTRSPLTGALLAEKIEESILGRGFAAPTLCKLGANAADVGDPPTAVKKRFWATRHDASVQQEFLSEKACAERKVVLGWPSGQPSARHLNPTRRHVAGEGNSGTKSGKRVFRDLVTKKPHRKSLLRWGFQDRGDRI